MPAGQERARWREAALKRGGLACLLWPLALLYGLLVRLRLALYRAGWLRSERLPVPVVVVGNVVVGGAGKTPTVIALVRHLRERGWHPGVVSRGYGRAGHAVTEVLPETPATLGGDEPTLIRGSTGVPVFVAPRRADAGRALLRTHPEVDLLVCDDGLQHLALARDLSVAVFDDRGSGNGWLLPAGLLREPWPPAPGHPAPPDLLLWQGREDPGPGVAPPQTHDLPSFRARRRLAPAARTPQGELIGLERLPAHGRLHAIAGIARPEVFFDMLRDRGLKLAHCVALPDHADTQAMLSALTDSAADVTWLCTEKDAVKLFPALLGSNTPVARVCCVPLELAVDPAFFAAIDARLPHPPGAA